MSLLFWTTSRAKRQFWRIIHFFFSVWPWIPSKQNLNFTTKNYLVGLVDGIRHNRDSKDHSDHINHQVVVQTLLQEACVLVFSFIIFSFATLTTATSGVRTTSSSYPSSSKYCNNIRFSTLCSTRVSCEECAGLFVCFLRHFCLTQVWSLHCLVQSLTHSSHC